MNQYRLGKQSRYNTISTESLVARCDAMCLKIKSVELSDLKNTKIQLLLLSIVFKFYVAENRK